MMQLQTIGQEHLKGFSVKIYYTENLNIIETENKNLYQIVYIDEGSVLVGDGENAKTLITPVLLCLNYFDPQKHIYISNAKGFSVFFEPEAINHGLYDNSDDIAEPEKADYLKTERLLIYPFNQSNKTNPVNLPVNGPIRERLLSMAHNIQLQFYGQPDDYWPCRGRSFFIEMLMLLQSLYKIQQDNSIGINATNSCIIPILKELHLNYSNQSFSIKTLHTIGLLGNGFVKFKTLRLFKKDTGMTIPSYLEHLRISVAENLLKDTVLDINEISRRCGFKNNILFSEAFSKKRKMSPLSWRAKFPDPYGH